MGILGLEGGSPTEVSVGFRRGWMRNVKIVLTSAGYLAVVAAAIKLLERQPHEGFGLLLQWGPWPFLAMAGLYLVGNFAMRGLEYLGKLAAGVQDSAVAIARLADKDDRERDRMITETSYIAAEMRKITTALNELKLQNARIEQSLQVNSREG